VAGTDATAGGATSSRVGANGPEAWLGSRTCASISGDHDTGVGAIATSTSGSRLHTPEVRAVIVMIAPRRTMSAPQSS